MKKYALEITVFICGAVVMILEIVGSRVLAPYVGTSVFVWTSLIGIILGSLSLGYFLGGKIADKKASPKILSTIIIISAVCIAMTTFLKSDILNVIQNIICDIRLSSTLAAIILFAPASIFLGMISPYAVKLKIESLKTSGKTVGNLYAISTIGSIVGTFLAGFVLIAYFGNTKLLLILAITLAITSLLPLTKKDPNLKITIIIGTLIVSAGLLKFINATQQAQAVIEVDTPYNHVQIYNTTYNQNGAPIKLLKIGVEYHSAMYLEGDELVFEYTKFYDLAKHFNPALDSALIIGGGAYSYPKYFLKNFPEAYIDVVEIDSVITELAKKYFKLKDNPRLKIYHEDGRTFLNKTNNKYDVVFIDAFLSSQSIPYQLTTKETVEKLYKILNKNGLILVNIISAIEEEQGKLLRAEYHTYKEIFPQVYIFPVRFPENGAFKQNIILIALKSEEKASLQSENSEFDYYLKHLWKDEIPKDVPILTDDFAPIDQYVMETL